MIERYITQTKSRARFEAGPMAYLFPTFICELEARRYSPDSIQRMIRTADRLGHWLQDHGILDISPRPTKLMLTSSSWPRSTPG